MSDATFVAAFGDVAEHSPWVAEAAATRRPFATREAMIAAFHAAVRNAPPDRQRELLRAHPDLAGRAAIAGNLTADSRNEQAGVGLDRLSREEYARFAEMNARYLEKNGFPFIFAVKGATKDQILDGFVSRLMNDPDTEFATALEQVCRIIGFRLTDRVAS
jgi:2-oxo-4-hydroxy-4-carboxy-5-ureidoimidazoline decarboxylase